MSAASSRDGGRPPLQNRVDPTGVLVATPERGGLMGNRGILHDDRQRLRLPRGWRPGRLLFTHQHWIICRLAFKDRHRMVMTPHRYTELFFLDEATALAAGHRPCAECRREDYDRFTVLWQELYEESGAETIDARLHAERLDAATRGRRLHTVGFDGLPDGAFVLHEGVPKLVLGETLAPWAFGGYGPPESRPSGAATLITPPSLAAILRAGWQPTAVPFLHPTAARSSEPVL